MEEIEHLVRSVAAGTVQFARPLGTRPEFRCNCAPGKATSLYYLASGFSSSFKFDPVDYLRIVVQIERFALVQIDKTELKAVARGPGYTLPVGTPISECHPAGYRSIALRVSPDALRTHLEALLGREVSSPICFTQPEDSDQRHADYVRRPIIAAAHELGFIDERFAERYIDEFENIMLTRLLLHSKHNYTSQLEGPVLRDKASRVRITEDYIQANWQRPLTTNALAKLVNVSGRALYSEFFRVHGITPAAYIKRLRLEKARALLKEDPLATVISVALACGFSSFGHFSDRYRRMFGELPSDTIKRARRDSK